MTDAQVRTLAPEVLASIADLELVARIIVEGLVSGLHRSPFHGYSAEFSQYRHYRPGDDLKYVDWKLVARTDRVYTKQFRETTNMAAALVVDTSASMGFPDPVSKLRYAVLLSAALAHLVVTQGDAIGLTMARTNGAAYLAPRTGRHHLRRVLGALAGVSVAGAWSAPASIRLAADRLGRRGLLIALSDFYDAEEETSAELRRAARMGHEVVMLQILSRAEVEFPFQDDLELIDLETNRRVTVNAREVRREYRDKVTSFIERWRTRAAGDGLQYSLVMIDEPPDRVLRRFLLARGG